MARLLQRLKNRKLVQWALAYSAAAFALIKVVASRFDWPPQLERTAIPRAGGSRCLTLPGCSTRSPRLTATVAR